MHYLTRHKVKRSILKVQNGKKVMANDSSEMATPTAVTVDSGNGRSSPRSVYYGNRSLTERKTPEGSQRAVPSRKVSWHGDGDITTSIEFPRVDPELKPSLFYNKSEISQFRAVEQRRIDKMMMKRIQRMVEEKMADEIEAAKARGATPEEIEAMMPQTPEQIFEILDMPVGFDSPPPPGMMDEPTSKVPKVVAEDEHTEKIPKVHDDEHESIDSTAGSENSVDNQLTEEALATAESPTTEDGGHQDCEVDEPETEPSHDSASSVDDTEGSSTNSHTTRKANTPVPTQRTDYDVHGGWSNPLETTS